MNITNQEPIEYRNLDTLRLHLTAILAAGRIGRRADDVWKDLPWKRFQTQVFRLQRGIFKAQKNGNKGKVKRLQRLLLQSRAAQALAVRLVTQRNREKKTPGVDGKTALTTKERLILCQKLNRHWHEWNHQKLRRVNIPKPNGKIRGLGIPTIADRAWQALLKYAAEPSYEATAGERSYGFRPGRSTQDAKQLTFLNLSSNKRGKEKIILETDISKCFDEIDHEVMLKGVVLPKAALKGLRKAIKAGVKGEYPSNEKGTPQGGVISPLLANIALDGFENLGSNQWTRKRSMTDIRGIRYADDAIFICKPGADIQQLRDDIDKFLKTRGLKLNEAKTKLSKATDGFDFLGWHFRVNSSGIFKSQPSQKSYGRIKEKVKATWRNTKLTTEARIKLIGSQIRGWRNYYKTCDMGNHGLWFLSHWLWKKLRKDKAKVSQKEAEKQRKLATKSYTIPKDGAAKRQSTTEQVKQAMPTVPWKVNSHIMVKGTASPFDGNTPYWVGRNSKLYNGPTASAIKRQKGKCEHCNLPFSEVNGPVELHHIDGNHNNWKPRNLVALHRPCHQAQPVHRKCIKDGLERRKGIKSPEPCEVKVSRTVRRRGALR